MACIAFALVLPFTVATSSARIGVEYQMALGNPSGAATTAALRTNYLIARNQYALSYNDDTHQANWVSWNFTSVDSGSSGRTDAWAVESELPSGYLKIGTATFGTGWDRGHMCPSGDRTISTADNEYTFRMSNMIPQASNNNQGLWAIFEGYCRSMASDGSEILITSGPSNFTGSNLSNGMAIPGSVWKIAVKVPSGTGTAAARTTVGCRVIAIVTPNVNSGLGTWQSYTTSVEQIEANTGFHFFDNVDPSVATYLKNVVDTGTGPNNPTVITSFSPSTAAAGSTVTINGYNFGSSPVVRFNGVTAVASSVSGNLIQATVPSGASTGNITVTGTGGTDTSASQFTLLVLPPTLTLSVPSLNGFSTLAGTVSPSQSYTLSGANLTSAITVNAPANYEISLDDNTFASSLTLSPASGSLASVPIHARIRSSALVGAVSGNITHSGGGATSQNLAVSGNVISATPSLALSTFDLSGFTALQGSAGPSKSYTVDGFNLTGAITATASAGFELSSDNLSFASTLTMTPANGGLSGVTVYVRLQSSATTSAVSGTISHSGGGAAAQSLAVSGVINGTATELVTLAAWEVTGISAYGPSPFAATSSNTQVTVGGLTRGAGVTTLNTAAGSAWGGNGFDGTATLANAITRGDYATFSVTPANGVQLSIDHIAAYNIRRSSSGAATGQWQYQLGNGAFVDIGTAINWGSVTTSLGNPQPAIDLSGVTALHNIPAGTTATFRLVAYGATSTGGNFYINNITGDDLAVIGSAATVTSSPPVIASAATAGGTEFEAFSYQISASNSPTSFAATSLPGGITLNTATGLLSGTPLVAGIYHSVITATNADGDGNAVLNLTVVTNPGAPLVGLTPDAVGHLRATFDYQLLSSNNPTAWLATNLPPGLVINPGTGRITGTPTAVGTYTVGITVQNAVGNDTKSFVITIVDPTLLVSASSLAEFAADLGSAGPSSTYSISGSDLAGAVTVSAPEGFEISLNNSTFSTSLSLTPDAGILPATPIIVRLGTTASLGAHDGALIHSGGGAIPKYLPVTGIVSALTPTLALSVSSLQGFTAVQGSPSFTQTYTVTGVNLTGSVTVTAPADYELSSDGINFATALVLQPTNGNLTSIPVEVRLAASAYPGTPAGILSHSGGGAPPQNLALSGTVSSAFSIAMSETFGLSGPDADPGADPDGDGFNNVQEYAFGLNPTIPGGNLVVQIPAAGAVTILYLQRVGVTYSVDSSADLTNWSAGAVTPVASSPQPSGLPPGFTQYEATLPVTSGKSFLRVQAVVP